MTTDTDNYIQCNFTGTVRITVSYQRAVIMVNAGSSLSNADVESRVQKKNGNSSSFVDFGTMVCKTLISDSTRYVSFNGGSSQVQKRAYEFQGQSYSFYHNVVPNDRFSLHNDTNAVTTTGAFAGASLRIEKV